MHRIALAEIVVLAVVQHSSPQVIIGRNGSTQGDRNLRETEALLQFLRYFLVALVVYLTGRNVGVGRADAENIARVLFVRDADIDILTQAAHNLAGLLFRPQLRAVVQVAADGDAAVLRCAAGCLADLSNVVTERGGNAGEVEPVHAFEDLIPVEIGKLGLRDRGTCAVVDDLRRTLARALLQEVNADTVAATYDLRCIHAVFAQ